MVAHASLAKNKTCPISPGKSLRGPRCCLSRRFGAVSRSIFITTICFGMYSPSEKSLCRVARLYDQRIDQQPSHLTSPLHSSPPHLSTPDLRLPRFLELFSHSSKLIVFLSLVSFDKEIVYSVSLSLSRTLYLSLSFFFLLFLFRFWTLSFPFTCADRFIRIDFLLSQCEFLFLFVSRTLKTIRDKSVAIVQDRSTEMFHSY